MRIISKNHDYYDSALAWGHDPNVVFDRSERQLSRCRSHFHEESNEIREYRFMEPHLRSRWSCDGEIKMKGGDTANVYPFTVAFCGKRYPGISVHTKSFKYFSYSFDDYANTLERLNIEFDARNRSRLSIFIGYGSVLSKHNCEEYFEQSGKDYTDFFALKRAPIVVWDEYGSDAPYLYFNPELRRWDFFKVFDPYRAFQELDMFISGVMTHSASNVSKVKPKKPNPVDISDEDLRDKKGFDDMSFKKPPTKNR